MSEITDFYLSWNGCASFGASGVRVRDQEPTVFKPTDISGCEIWLDANDNDTILTNELLFVESWVNKGALNFNFDISGNAPVIYGSTIVNGLNTVSFTPDSFMQASFPLDFQARSVFIVTKENNVPANTANPWLASDTSNGMEVFSLVNGTQTYFMGKHPSPVPTLAFETSTIYTGYPALVEFINSSNSNDNWMGVNTQKIEPIYSVNASGFNTSNITYYLGGYFGGSNIPSSQDFCEMIIYNGALNSYQREEVEKYLMTKWAITEPTPTPVPPAPFAPTDISGLYIWYDANNLTSLSLSGSNVTSWSNLGLASNVATSNIGTVVSVQDSNANNNYVTEFSPYSDLDSTMTLPYQTRTQLAVFNILDDLSALSYPYVNIFQTFTETAMQSGVSYDSNANKYNLAMCQAGQNCPVYGVIPNYTSNAYSLAIWISDSADSNNNRGYWNGGSNINASIDLGNLFATSNVAYYINTANSNGPIQRIGEVLEYNSVLSASNLSTVANYLVTKWGLSSFTEIV